MKVAIYWNTQRHCFSIQARQRSAHFLSGRVVAHSEDIVLQNVVPSVRQSGLQKLRESGVRNVHAFLTGLWLPENAIERARLRNAENGVPVWYDPFRHGAFVNSSGSELLYADRVICSSFNQTPSLIAVGGEFSD